MSRAAHIDAGGATRADRASAAVLAFTLVAYAALASGYATLTPIWQNPDEPAHYNYVAFVASTGGLPSLQQGDWNAALLERLKSGTLAPGDRVESIRYESWQPPLFYVAAAPVFRLGPSDPGAIVLRLRLFNAVLGALTLCVAYVAAREFMQPWLARAVPLAIAGVPMFTSLSASISADPLANLLAACALVALLRQVRAAHVCSRSAAGTGILIGLGLLTKLALGIFVPLALAVVVLRSARRVRAAALLLGGMGAVVLPWLVHQVTTYGWADPLATSRHAAVVFDQPRFPGLSAAYIGAFLTTSFHSFWAQFGWMSIVAPDRLYWLYGALVLLALAGWLVKPRQLRDPAWRLIGATVAAALVGYVGYNLEFQQFQGRYVFSALVPIAALLVAGWAAWLPVRLRAYGVGVVVLALLAANAYALTRVLVVGFAPPG